MARVKQIIHTQTTPFQYRTEAQGQKKGEMPVSLLLSLCQYPAVRYLWLQPAGLTPFFPLPLSLCPCLYFCLFFALVSLRYSAYATTPFASRLLGTPSTPTTTAREIFGFHTATGQTALAALLIDLFDFFLRFLEVDFGKGLEHLRVYSISL